jgi:hypothetical protein
MENVKKGMEFRSKDFIVNNNEILGVLFQKVCEALEKADKRDVEMYISECTHTENEEFASFDVIPYEIFQIADELENIAPEGCFVDSVSCFGVDLVLKDLIWLGVDEIKERIEEAIANYKKSIFYIWQRDNKENANNDLDITLEVTGETAIMWIDNTKLIFKSENDYMLSDNIYTNNMDIEKIMNIADGIKSAYKALEEINSDTTYGYIEKEDLNQSILSWIDTLKQYEATNSVCGFDAEQMCYVIIDEQGNVIETQI